MNAHYFMKTNFLFLLLFSLSILSSCKDDNGFEAPINTTNEQVLIDLVNESRASGCNCGDEYFPPVNPVIWNDTLELAAYDHSEDMDRKEFFDHTGSDGSNAGERIEKYMYSWTTWGENIAMGFSSEEEVVKGWLESPGHCKNIMKADFKEMGIAKVGTYWTQVFASH